MKRGDILFSSVLLGATAFSVILQAVNGVRDTPLPLGLAGPLLLSCITFFIIGAAVYLRISR